MDNDKDQDWLDALSGKPNVDADPDVTRHANALRQAIQRHDAVFHSREADTEVGLQKLKFRLRREGLTGSDQRTTLKRFFQFAIAASVFMTLGMVLQSALHEQATVDELQMLNLRGEGKKIPQVVENSIKYLTEIEASLNNLGADYSVKQLEGGHIELTIKTNYAVIELLQSKRIEVNEKDKLVILEIQSIKTTTQDRGIK